MASEILTGGSMNQVEKMGDVVHKTSKGSEVVCAYLLYLEQSGMTGVPKFLGIDERGREMFSYLKGKTVGNDYEFDDPLLKSEATITGMAKFLRELHDFSVRFVPKALELGWKNPYSDGPFETICHGDAAIWNFVFEDDKIAGLFDFEQAYPGTRIWDLTSTVAMTILPFYYDYHESRDDEKTKKQIKIFFDAYGMPCPQDFIEIVINRIQRDFCDKIINGARQGDSEYIKMLERGDVEHYERFIKHLRLNGHKWI